MATASHLHPRAELDDARRRNAEVIGCTYRILRHEGIDALLPKGQLGPERRDRVLASEEERCSFRLGADDVAMICERFGNVGLLGEAEVQLRLLEAGRELLDLE